MADLVACLSTGKGSWKKVTTLIEERQWDTIFLITNEFGKKNFVRDDIPMVVIDRNQTVAEMSEVIQEYLREKVDVVDVALNFQSGSGKEHMAVLDAVMNVGLGFRLVSVEKGDIIVH